jgi:hypothetical protein
MAIDPQKRCVGSGWQIGDIPVAGDSIDVISRWMNRPDIPLKPVLLALCDDILRPPATKDGD